MSKSIMQLWGKEMMKCVKCGSAVHHTAKFCRICATQIKKTKSKNENERIVASSLENIKNLPGFYCYECGGYVKRGRDVFTCPYCNSRIIGANMVQHVANAFGKGGLLGGALALSFSLGGMLTPKSLKSDNDPAFLQPYASSDADPIYEYYDSEYYKNTKYLFENVICDKGRTGEYCLEREIKKAMDTPLRLPYEILYNLVIREPNGLFQEIDAILIVGGMVFVFEAKNRLGRFVIDHWDSKNWRQQQGGNSEDIYSPLLQNSEHIVALKHFLAQYKIPHFCMFNVVVMGSMAEIVLNDPIDDYEHIILDGHKVAICNISKLEEIIKGFVKTVYQAENILLKEQFNTDEERRKCLNDYYVETTECISDFLKKEACVEETTKRLLFREREVLKDTANKQPYKYFYHVGKSGKAFITRTNGVYYQYTTGAYEMWVDAYCYNQNGEVIWFDPLEYPIEEYTQILLDTPMKLVEAYKCVQEQVPYTQRW